MKDKPLRHYFTEPTNVQPTLFSPAHAAAECAVAPMAVGDVLDFGNHRLACGDGTDTSAVTALAGEPRCDLLVVDPPHNVPDLYAAALTGYYSPERRALVFWDSIRAGAAISAALGAGWTFQYEFVWDCISSWYVPSRPLARHKACGLFAPDNHWDYDSAIVHDGKHRTPRFTGNHRGRFWNIPPDEGCHLSTVYALPITRTPERLAMAKPVEWVAALIAGAGATRVLDPFAGSGTTAIACQRLGLGSVSVELDCDIAGYAARRIEEAVRG
jgi:hypothetical protein